MLSLNVVGFNPFRGKLLSLVIKKLFCIKLSFFDSVQLIEHTVALIDHHVYHAIFPPLFKDGTPKRRRSKVTHLLY